MSDTTRWCFVHKSPGFDSERITWCRQVDRTPTGSVREKEQRRCVLVDAIVTPVTDERLSRAEWEATIDYEAGEEAFRKAWSRAEVGGVEGGLAVAFKAGVDEAVKGET